MLCLNCGKKVASTATSCKFCKMKFEAQPQLDHDELVQLLNDAGVDADLQEEMRQLAQDAGSADEFANSIFLGDCPKCGSKKVENCDEVKGIENVTVGHCLDCGLFWCSECGYHLKKGEKECPHWKVCGKCPDEDDCPYIVDATECEKVATWSRTTQAH